MSFTDVSLYILDSLRNCCQALRSRTPHFLIECNFVGDGCVMIVMGCHFIQTTLVTQCVTISYVQCSGPGESRRGDTALTIPTSPAGWPELLVMEVIMQNLGMPGKLIQCKTQNIYLTCVQCTKKPYNVNQFISFNGVSEGTLN